MIETATNDITIKWTVKEKEFKPMSKFIPKTATELEWARQQVMGQTKKSYDEWHNTVINWPNPLTGPYTILQGEKEKYEAVARAAEKVVDTMKPEELKKILAENGIF